MKTYFTCVQGRPAANVASFSRINRRSSFDRLLLLAVYESLGPAEVTARPLGTGCALPELLGVCLALVLLELIYNEVLSHCSRVDRRAVFPPIRPKCIGMPSLIYLNLVCGST